MQKFILVIILASFSAVNAQDALRIQSETVGSFELVSFNTTPNDTIYQTENYTTPSGGNVITFKKSGEVARKQNIVKTPKATLKLYPNPGKGIYTINISNTAANYVEVCSILGEVIYTQPISSNSIFELDITSFTKGIFFIKITCVNGSILTGKLVYQ